MLEAEHPASLRIDAGHHIFDGAILSGGVHRLENQQHCITVECAELLLLAQLMNLLSENLLILFLWLISRLHQRQPLFELALFPPRHTEIFDIYFHLDPVSPSGVLLAIEPLSVPRSRK